MRATFFAISLIIVFQIAFAHAALLVTPPEDVAPASRKTEMGKRWISQGVRVGQHLDDHTVYSLDGKAAKLALLWKDRPVLLITASLTCPVAREQCPSIRSIIDMHDPEVRTVLLYTIEAHPKGDHSPYRPETEWVTAQNEQEDILHRQPQSLEDRLKLANDMHARVGEIAPMLVDAMDNSAWKALGGGPNMAVLIDVDGKVIAKQGWLDASAMVGEIDALLKRRNNDALAAYEASKKSRPHMEAFIEAARSDDRAARERFYSPQARIWFGQKTGPGNPVAVSPWREWDEELQASHDVEQAEIHVDAVVITSREINDFARLIGFSGWRSRMTYRFHGDGLIHEILYEPQDVSPSFRECFAPAREWALKHKPDEMKVIFPNNDFAPSAETARRWRHVLIEWRKATGSAENDNR